MNIWNSIKKMIFILKLQESKISTYERMWKIMSGDPNVFVGSSKEGLQKVKKGGFAYILGNKLLIFSQKKKLNNFLNKNQPLMIT